jgi:hypothetical protein
VNELLALLMDPIDFASGGPIDGYTLKIGFGFIGWVAKDVNLDTPLCCVAKNDSSLLVFGHEDYRLQFTFGL